MIDDDYIFGKILKLDKINEIDDREDFLNTLKILPIKNGNILNKIHSIGYNDNIIVLRNIDMIDNKLQFEINNIVYMMSYERTFYHDYNQTFSYNYFFKSLYKNELYIDNYKDERIVLMDRYNKRINDENNGCDINKYKIYVDYYNLETGKIMENIQLYNKYNEIDANIIKDCFSRYGLCPCNKCKCDCFEYNKGEFIFKNNDCHKHEKYFESPLRVFNICDQYYSDIIKILIDSNKDEHIFILKIIKV